MYSVAEKKHINGKPTVPMSCRTQRWVWENLILTVTAQLNQINIMTTDRWCKLHWSSLSSEHFVLKIVVLEAGIYG